jgi:type IV pilus modification protein PilV
MKSGLSIGRDVKLFLARLFVPGAEIGSPLSEVRKSHPGTRGFTLLEVLISLLLLSVGVMAVVSMFSVSMHANLMANQHTVANNLGQAALEDILAKDITDPVFGATTSGTLYYPVTFPATTSSPTTTTVTGAGTYTTTYSVTVGSDANGIGSENAMVSVTVTGPGIISSGLTFSGLKRIV